MNWLSMRIVRSLGIVCAASLLACGSAARGQGAPAGPLTPQPGVVPEQAPPPKNPIRVQANEVVAPVIVTDKNGEMILSLKQKDFHIFDDGVEKPIDNFGLGGQPLSIVLLLENSARIAALLPAIRKSGVIFAQPVLGETAEAAALEYDDQTRTLVKFTTNPDPLEAAINTLEVGNGGAMLYDAMQRGISLLEERSQDRRRVLLVVGEGQDTGSVSTLGEVLRRAQVANVTIYSVGLSTNSALWRSKPQNDGPYMPPLPTGDERQDQMNRQMQSGGDLLALAVLLLETGKNAIGPNSLAVASKATGGLHLGTLRDRSIEKAMDQIGGELHAQYTIGYRPPDDKPFGYHEIKVTVNRPDVVVRTRPGYYWAGSDAN
jgi:VWFA-related protein